MSDFSEAEGDDCESDFLRMWDDCVSDFLRQGNDPE